MAQINLISFCYTLPTAYYFDNRDSALGRCDACFRINFKNAAQDRDIMCLKEQGEGTCIFTGNLLGDRSFFAVTATNARQCRPFSNDPLEVS